MNSFAHNCLLWVVSGFIFVSCTKTTNNPVPNPVTPTTPTTPTTTKTTDTVIYIAGDNAINPILWKNGIADTLSPTTGSASQVFLSGNDVYAAGVCQEIENFSSPGVLSGPITGQYAYWKNGTQNNVGIFGNVGPNASISVTGANVYFSDSSVWVNGATISLPGMGSVQAVFAVGNDVYVAGYDSARDVVYWKNGVLNIVSPFRGHGFTTPYVSCIYVSGNDVYLGGMFDVAAYWKNGVINYLQARTTDASFVSIITSIFVSGSDVYTTGYLIEFGLPAGVNIAAYWKNGFENDLSLSGAINANTTYTTSSIFVYGSDVYVAGYSSTSTSPNAASLDSAIYWKDNVENHLLSAGRANSIIVH
jgi:hypothetical protein